MVLEAIDNRFICELCSYTRAESSITCASTRQQSKYNRAMIYRMPPDQVTYFLKSPAVDRGLWRVRTITFVLDFPVRITVTGTAFSPSLPRATRRVRTQYRIAVGTLLRFALFEVPSNYEDANGHCDDYDDHDSDENYCDDVHLNTALTALSSVRE